MTGTPYEKWFTPSERERYHEVMGWRTPDSPGHFFRPPMSRLKWLVRTDMTLAEMSRELGIHVESVRRALRRMDLHPSDPAPIKGPTYMAHDWYMGRKDHRIWV